jgi:ferredoxin
MIVAERKKIPELLDIVREHKKVLVLGCGTCVTVCLAGGEREVGIISSALRIASRLQGLDPAVEELTIERQCDNVFIEQAADAIARNDAVLSLGCGAGVQAVAERCCDRPVYAGLDTTFIGILEEQGVWAEKCAACGACILHEYGGICPVTRCAKRMLNGPCGGSREDRCEVRPDPAMRLAAHLCASEGDRTARPAPPDCASQGPESESGRRPTPHRAPGPPDLRFVRELVRSPH